MSLFIPGEKIQLKGREGEVGGRERRREEDQKGRGREEKREESEG